METNFVPLKHKGDFLSVSIILFVGFEKALEWIHTQTHRVEFYYLSCRSAHICARVFVSVHIE